MRCMPIVPPKNKVTALKHETVIEIVNRVHLQSANGQDNRAEVFGPE